MDKSRLYYQIPYVKSFMCTVEELLPGRNGTWLALLDRTGFYPEGGGQPSDTGTLGGVKVLSVHEQGGRILHQLEAELELGAAVEGIIDWTARYDHMQHHTGEHILSGLVHSRYGYDNVGFHMGAEEVTMDFNGLLSAEQLEELEDEANRLVCANLPVEERFPGGEELAALDYRSKKELSGLVRIITVPGADICACCGTHVKNTGEVGIIKITGLIHYKGGVRISILCGRKALLDYRRKMGTVGRISNLLSVKPELAGAAVEKLKADSQQKEYQIGKLGLQLSALKTAAYEDSEKPLVLFEEEMGPVRLRQLCTMLYEQNKGGVVLVCSGSEEQREYQYALGSARADMRILSKGLNSRLNGRGGGSSLMAQGTYHETSEAIAKAFAEEAEKL